jgi:hypothetical protein
MVDSQACLGAVSVSATLTTSLEGQSLYLDDLSAYAFQAVVGYL